MRKANNIPISKEYLQKKINPNFPKAKWIGFCEDLLEMGFQIKLYEARETVSKYVTVFHGQKQFKVRFSNHKPIREKEMNGDCDFFVGVTHTGWRTTEMAMQAVKEYFQVEKVQ